MSKKSSIAYPKNVLLFKVKLIFIDLSKIKLL